MTHSTINTEDAIIVYHLKHTREKKMPTTIELSEGSIQILDKQELTDRHVMFIKVDCGNLPFSRQVEYLEQIKEAFKDVAGTARVVIMPKTTEITVFETPEEDV